MRRSTVATLLVVLLTALAARAEAKPQLGRLWVYGWLTGEFTPEWSVTVMPGTRVEALRSEGETLDHYMDELFVGPNWTKRFGPGYVRLSLWYYFTGYDILDDYKTTHSLEFIATAGVTLGPLGLSSRTIFHNILYADVYGGPSSLRNGYSLVIREKIQATWQVGMNLAVVVASEPFFGVVADADAPHSMLGFWDQGTWLHRLYAGLSWRPTPNLGIDPQYIYETDLDGDGHVTHHGHYLFVSVGYRFRFFE